MNRNLKLSAAALAAFGELVLTGCSTIDPSTVPVVDRSQYSAGTSAGSSAPGLVRDSGRTHVVAPGDTIYNISVRYGLDAGQLARLNAITDPTQLRIGQSLRLPESVTEPRPYEVSSSVRVNRVTDTDNEPKAPETAETPSTVVRTPSSNVEETTAITNAPAKPAEGSAAAPSPKPEKAPAIVPGTRLLWPARGEVLATYTQNKMGLDIGGTVGDVVVAAADGTVLFVGDGVKGYGQLVIVQHTKTFVTAYGHNSKIVVKVGDKVRAGQKISELGGTDPKRPFLRFEVRDHGKPVDPMKYLAPRR